MDEFGRNELHYVAVDVAESEQGSETLRLIKLGVDVNAHDNNGWTPLHFAAQAQSFTVAKILIEHGSNIETKDTFGNTPLFRAVFNSQGKGDVIKLLLKSGADPESRNNNGVSPKSLAEKISNYDVKNYFE